MLWGMGNANSGPHSMERTASVKAVDHHDIQEGRSPGRVRTLILYMGYKKGQVRRERANGRARGGMSVEDDRDTLGRKQPSAGGGSRQNGEEAVPIRGGR